MTFVETWAKDQIEPRALANPAARRFAEIFTSGAFPVGRLLGAFRSETEGGEALTVELDVERPSRPIHDIRRTEQMLLVFAKTDVREPSVFALRPNFPSIEHTNLTPKDWPVSLCLYDTPAQERRLTQTPLALLERIRWWLKQAALGRLHAPNQPVEALFEASSITAVIDRTWLEDTSGKLFLVGMRPAIGSRRVLVGDAGAERHDERHAVATITLRPTPHGRLRHAPVNFQELLEALAELDPTWRGTFDARLKQWMSTQPDLFDLPFLLVLALPIQRLADAAPEATQLRAFLFTAPLATLVERLGLGGRSAPGQRVAPLLKPHAAQRLDKIGVLVANAVLALDAVVAAQVSGRAAPRNDAAVLVGAGAVGSCLTDALTRAGFGRWSVVDADDLLPHNLTRHALSGMFVGVPKAIALAHHIGRNRPDLVGQTIPLAVDALDPGDQREKLVGLLADARYIVDASASLPVARALARDVASDARRISVFVNPRGTDIVLLAEDRRRTLPLDILEMQYYRALLRRNDLHDHLRTPDARVFVGSSCRDSSLQLLGARINALTNLAATELLCRVFEADDAVMAIWRHDVASGRVDCVRVTPLSPRVHAAGDWTIIYDDAVLDQLMAWRAAALPSETGGVLLGVYDLVRKRIYVVDVIAAPADSRSSPDAFERGVAGLRDAVLAANAATGGQLHYVGEWHSHPAQTPTDMSGADVLQLVWLSFASSLSDAPVLMMIVGDERSHSINLAELRSCA